MNQENTDRGGNRLLYLGNLLGMHEHSIKENIIENSSDIKEAIESILQLKEENRNKMFSVDIDGVMQDTFDIDGSIVLSKSDFLTSGEGVIPDGEIYKWYLNNLLEFFGEFKGDKFVFRNKYYYFLNNGIIHDGLQKHKSINSVRIEDINFEKFKHEFNGHYSINEGMFVYYEKFFRNNLHSSISGNINDFSEKFYDLCSEKKIKIMEGKMDLLSEKYTGEKRNNIIYQNKEALSVFKILYDHIQNFINNQSEGNFIHMFIGFSDCNGYIEYLAHTFDIDLNELFTDYVPEINNGMKKIILGLLDAKINSLAFMQNLSQILTNDNFLNPDFEGNLVFHQPMIREMKKLSPDAFKKFKNSQKLCTQSDNKIEISQMLNHYIGYYIDILLGDKQESLLRICSRSPNIEKNNNGILEVEHFTEVFDLLKNLLSLIDNYGDKIEEKNQKKLDQYNKKRNAKISKGISVENDKKPSSNDNYITAKSLALNKLIRLYREENDPLVMIKTAQNAFVDMMKKGLDENDILYFMSVNYGGSLIGHYVKPIFTRLCHSIGKNVNINNGNLVFSIYDVKNADQFSSIIDYPYIEESGGEKDGSYIDRKWLIIFDDNTNSGETVKRISDLAEQGGKYGKIDFYVCRSSSDLSKYSDQLSSEEILSIISNSGIEHRRTTVNKEGLRYKELLGTIIGNRLYKQEKQKFKYKI